MAELFGWNKNLNFEATKTQLIYDLNSTELNQNDKVKVSILLTQLINGSRISEAINAYNQFIARKDSFSKVGKNKRYIDVIIEKRGWKQFYIYDANGNKVIDHINRYKGNDGEEKVRKYYKTEKKAEQVKKLKRLVIIPAEISDSLPTYPHTKNAINNFSQKRYGYNTHALRYCWQTDDAQKGTPSQITASTMGHSSTQHLIKYTDAQAGRKHLIDRIEGDYIASGS